MKPSTLLLIAVLLFLVGCILIVFTVNIEAAQVESEFWLQDTSTDPLALSGFVRDLWDGTRIDLRSFDAEGIGISVAFAWGSSNPITEYIDRIEWTVSHTGLGSPVEFVTHGSANGYSWPMCNTVRDGTRSPIGCSLLKTKGSVTINARAIYDDHGRPPTVALVAEDSRAFRIVDTTPTVRERPRRGPPVPYCSGDPDVCDETVSNASLWKALTALCDGRPGAKLWLGRKGAYIQCP